MKKYTTLKYLFLVLMLAGFIGLCWWMVDRNQTETIMEEVEEYLVKEEDSYVIREEVKEINSDTVAWIIVEGTNINYPVVQTTNNDYYLKHDYYKKKNSAGWVFMDYHNRLEDQNLIIYGHHRKDGIMFGDIDKLFKESYYKDHDGIITLVVGDETYHYKIYSVFIAGSDEDYIKNNYQDFYDEIIDSYNKSEIKFDVELTDIEQIITLSTCHKNNKDRLVVRAYKILK